MDLEPFEATTFSNAGFTVFTQKEKHKYRCVMYGSSKNNWWTWKLVCINGECVLQSPRIYGNRTQCRNVMKHFAEHYGIEWRDAQTKTTS